MTDDVLKDIIFSPMMRLVTFLINGREFQYTLNDLVEGTDLAKTTVWRKIQKLKKEKYVKVIKTGKNREKYQIDMKSKNVLLIQKLDKLFMDSVLFGDRK